MANAASVCRALLHSALGVLAGILDNFRGRYGDRQHSHSSHPVLWLVLSRPLVFGHPRWDSEAARHHRPFHTHGSHTIYCRRAIASPYIRGVHVVRLPCRRYGVDRPETAGKTTLSSKLLLVSFG